MINKTKSAKQAGPAPVIAVLALAILAFVATPAFAEQTYVPSGVSFGEPGSGPGQLSDPIGVAVNDASPLLDLATGGDVYVVDNGNDRVERFRATGEYKGQFDGSGDWEDREEPEPIKTGAAAPTGKLSRPEHIAVNDDESSPSFGDVYVADQGHDVIDKFSPTGEYMEQVAGVPCPELVEREGEVCVPGTTAPFARVEAIGVTPSGDLWVSYGLERRANGRLNSAAYIGEFNEPGALVRYSGPSGYSGENVAFDSLGTPYLLQGVSYLFKMASEEAWHVVQEFDRPATTVAINPSTDNLLLDYGGSIGLYGKFGELHRGEFESLPIGLFGTKEVHLTPIVVFGEGLSGSEGLAVNAGGTAFASESGGDRVKVFDFVDEPKVTTEAASNVTETSITLQGTVNAEGEPISQCYFEYGTEAGKYTNKKGEPNRVPCGSNEKNPGEGCGQNPSGKNEEVAVCAVLTGLEPAQVRSFRLVVEAGSHLIKEGAGLTITRPVIAAEQALEVGFQAAGVRARVGGGGLSASTCWWIEYGTSVAYGASTSPRCAAPGEEEATAGVELTGLQPAREYHFRVLARNALGEDDGADATFTTFGLGAGELPDGRVYEAVSPLGTGGFGSVYVPGGMLGSLDELDRHGISTSNPFQVAASGEAVSYAGDPPPRGGNGNEGHGGGNVYLARRSPGGGWTQADVNASGYGNGVVGFSGDLSAGALASSASGEEVLGAGAPEGYPDLYRRAVGWSAAGEGSFEAALGSFEALSSATPPCPAKEFGYLLNGKLENGLGFAGGNAGTGVVAPYSHILFESDAGLPSTPAAPAGCGAGNDLYGSFGGRLYLVNVLPNGSVEQDATFGRQGPSTNGVLSPEFSGAISADGSRIYWSAVNTVEVSGGTFEEQPQKLYVRENATQPPSPVEEGECTVPTDACTLQVDQAEPGVSHGHSGGGQFWSASEDGSRALFTDENKLTPDSAAVGGAPELYEYDLKAPEEERLTDLSAPPAQPVCPSRPGGVCGPSDVQGVLGASADGSYVYFVADGILTEGANVEGRKPVEGQPNLYVRHEGRTVLIATLSQEEDDFTHEAGGSDGDWQADPGHRTAEVTPDGRSVVFMSRLPLTGYGNALDGVPLTEVFVYDAGTERLVCASCNPSGEAPVPFDAEFIEHEALKTAWGSFLPVSDSLGDYQPRLISDDGDRVFFDSLEPLVPQAANGMLDVYEWEAQGEGSCREARGCVYLLSSGQGDESSYLIGASSSGGDVFFVSRAQLLSTDRGDTDVLYDARVGGVPPREEAGCSGTGCQGVPSGPPIFATPASATVTGVHDLEPSLAPEAKKVTKKTVKCPKGKIRKHNKCVKSRKPKKSKKAKRAGRDGRPSS